MPGGVSSPVRSFKAVKNHPVYIKQGKGAVITDIDGNSYIDYVMSFGPLILGHAPQSVVKKLHSTLKQGTSFGAPVEEELELAKKVVRIHDAVEWVRFVNSGTEAVMSALRLARGVTKRNLVIKFEGCYHGHVDSLLVKGGSGLATFGTPNSLGIPEDLVKHTVVLPLGDKDQFDQVMKTYGDQVAAVIIEGVPANMGLFPQHKEFLHYIQRYTQEQGGLFILDEVITGFRVGLKGATHYYELKPDLVTLGKIIGGGLPVGAYGGKKEYMELVAPLGGVYQAGTLSGNPLAMAAGNATLEYLEKNPSLYQDLANNTELLEKGIQDLATDLHIPLHTSRFSSMLWLAFQEPPLPLPTHVTKQATRTYAEFHFNALMNGLYLPPSAYEVWFLSTQHDKGIITKTLETLELILQQVKEVITH